MCIISQVSSYVQDKAFFLQILERIVFPVHLPFLDKFNFEKEGEMEIEFLLGIPDYAISIFLFHLNTGKGSQQCPQKDLSNCCCNCYQRWFCKLESQFAAISKEDPFLGAMAYTGKVLHMFKRLSKRSSLSNPLLKTPAIDFS